MKQKTNRWLSMLLAFIMLLTLVPTMNVFAGYEDGEDCWHCGHYHWDGYLCGCGACSTSCTMRTAGLKLTATTVVCVLRRTAVSALSATTVPNVWMSPVGTAPNVNSVSSAMRTATSAATAEDVHHA